MKFSLDIKRSEQLANICGSLDKNLENIANNLDVTISNKGADFNIKGNNAAEAVLCSPGPIVNFRKENY